MSIAVQTFTGVSSFSSDFQSILQRSVSIASLPVQALQNDQQELVTKKMALTEMRTAAEDLQASLASLGKMQTGGALTATASDSAVTATIASGATPGSFQITNISSLATAASATLATGLATASATAVAGSGHKVEVVIGSKTQTLTLTEATDNLNGLRDAINNAHLGVTAAVIDTGSASGAARYFLSLTAVEGGPKTLGLRTTPGNSGTELMQVTQPGSNAVFELNGKTVTSATNLLTTAIPGVNLRLNAKTTGQTVNVEVAANSTPVGTALQSLATAYNALVDKVDAQKGETAGALSGDSVVNELSQVLRQVSGYRDEATGMDLAALGISLDTSGKMTVDTSVTALMTTDQLNTALGFLGSGGTGLSSLAETLADYTDMTSGTIQMRLDTYTTSDSRLSDQIDAINERVSAMQSTLVAKLQAADTLLASLESQKSMLTATIDSLNMVTNGKKSS